MAAARADRSLLLLLNGKAAADERIRAWVLERRQQGHRIEVRALWEAGQARTFAAEAARLGCQVVVSAGGDGTLNETVNGLFDSDGPKPALAVLPFGTANDFASAAGIADMELEVAIDLALHGPARPIDVARVNGRHFINVASGGFPAEITTETPAPLKRLLGGFAYSLTGLVKAFDVNARTVTLRGPGFHWHGQLLFFAVANGQRAGGGMQLAPQARLDDGKLDVVVVPDGNVPTLAGVLESLFHGHDSPNIVRAQVDRLDVEAPDGIQVNVDGEPVFSNSFRFELVGEKLPAILPKN